MDEYSDWLNEHSGEEPTDGVLLEIMEAVIAKAPSGLQCSMFGVWGSRTLNGDLYSARNLDWASNLGIDQYKCVQVWHPEGAYEHSAVGYVVVYGVLAGMSSKGISVHEANLRYIMENSNDINDAWALWEATNNTIGFNHMVAS